MQAQTNSPSNNVCDDSSNALIAACAKRTASATCTSVSTCQWCPTGIGTDAGCYPVDVSVYCTTAYNDYTYLGASCPVNWNALAGSAGAAVGLALGVIIGIVGARHGAIRRGPVLVPF